MAFLPQIQWKKDGDEIQQLRNYVMQLEEQLRYVLNNLGAENLTDGAIGENALAPSVKTEILESKNSAQKNRMAIKKTAKELMVKVEQEIADRQSGETTLSNQISSTAEGLSGEIAEVEDGAYKKQTGFDITADGVKVKSTGSFTVEAGAGFNVHSQNLDCDETGLLVKSGTMQGEHYTTDGFKLLSESDIVVSTETPETEDGRIWVKPLDSVTVNYYSEAITQRTNIIGYSGTLNTSGAASGSGGTCSYTLRIPYHVSTSSGSGADITATVGGLTFTGHINPGHYSGPSTYVGDGTFEATVISSTWIGSNNSLSISISGSAPGNTDKYKINVGQITLTAKSAGSSGAGWKSCEIKVYQG